MIDEFESGRQTVRVARLVSLPKKSLNVQLLERNIAAEDIEDVASAVQAVEPIMTAEDAINFTFTRTPIPAQRYNTSRFRVLYTAVERETCIAELRHHVGRFVEEGAPRFFQVIEATANGSMVELCGYEEDYPELVSPTDAGYPFCQALALEAMEAGHHALRAPSARAQGGKCVPIFYRDNVSDISAEERLSFVRENAELAVRRV